LCACTVIVVPDNRLRERASTAVPVMQIRSSRQDDTHQRWIDFAA